MIGKVHCAAKLGKRLATADCSHQERVGFESGVNGAQRPRQVVDGVEGADRKDEIIRPCGGAPFIFGYLGRAGGVGVKGARIRYFDRLRELGQSVAPVRIGASQQEGGFELSSDQRQALEAIGEGSLVQE